MSPTLNGSSVLQCFEHSNAIEIRNGIMFDFYPGLPQIENRSDNCILGTLNYVCWRICCSLFLKKKLIHKSSLFCTKIGNLGKIKAAILLLYDIQLLIVHSAIWLLISHSRWERCYWQEILIKPPAGGCGQPGMRLLVAHQLVPQFWVASNQGFHQNMN